MLTLHGYWRSTASYRVKIALRLKDLEVVHKPVSLKTGAHLKPEAMRRYLKRLYLSLKLKMGTALRNSLR